MGYRRTCLFTLLLMILASQRPLGTSVLANPASESAPAHPGSLVLYSGRSRSLVEPLVRQFRKQTGIQVTARYGKTAQMALAITEEGKQSPADVFWAQDAGALGSLSKLGLFAKLPEAITQTVKPLFTNPSGLWVATSGRARILAYSSTRLQASELPQSVFDLTHPKWKGRVGWAPTNASFQSFLTAMRSVHGQDKARQWLIAMKNNGTLRYAKNTPIIRALADGRIDLGLPNHYYLLRFKKTDPQFPVAQQFFKAGDVGNLVNVAGIGQLKTSAHAHQAQQFIAFLLAKPAQQYFTSQIFEYPVIHDLPTHSPLPGTEELEKIMPPVNLNDLIDLPGTRKLLREVGLL